MHTYTYIHKNAPKKINLDVVYVDVCVCLSLFIYSSFQCGS